MAVPSYNRFIEPILRYLALQEGGVAASDAHKVAARTLRLSDDDRTLRLGSGVFAYKNRAGWAFDRLKRSGLATAPEHGVWMLTAAGRRFAADHPALTPDQISELALGNGPPMGAAVAPTGDRRAYRLADRPLAKGGQAEVFVAVRKSDKKELVLKRVLALGERRMRREIETQSALDHENIMPLIDWDANKFSWYVMPRGTRTMASLTPPVEHQMLCTIVESVASALEFSHAAGHPHRDVKPENVIELPCESSGARWVLADWGLTRRPLGETTTALTETGRMVGTDGYAPPEAYEDGHRVGEPGDIYALGQLIGWATTGKMPLPNVALNAPEPWRRLVKHMTRLDPAERIQSIGKVREALGSIERDKGESGEDLYRALDDAAKGDQSASVRACVLALDKRSDHDLFLDRIAKLNNVAPSVVKDHPEEAWELANAMSEATESFGRRDFDYANVPLKWIHQLAVEAAETEQLDLLENICDVLFPLETKWDRFRQRDITRAWLASLDGAVAEVVAQCLAAVPKMSEYVGRLPSGTHPKIRSAFVR